jgi:lipopolysaccharide transport system ATP-binding protein
MGEPAIRIDGLGKRYRLASTHGHRGYRTLRESLSDGVRGLGRRLRRDLAGRDQDFWALRDTSFEVQPGEVLGVIGRNGAGKSTLLKILSRITRPTTGRAEVNGRVGSLLEVGTGFHPELTGRDNIFLNGSILGMSRREIASRFDEIVAFAEIEQFLDTPVKRYSSGMYVRLAFAVAAHLNPEILIVDEVLAVGDAGFQKKCLDRMKTVSTQGRTILFVSHNLPALENLCDSGVLLSGGRVAARGSIQDVLAQYNRREKVAGQAEVDLAGHPNLRGGLGPRLQRLSLSSNGQSTAAVRMGRPLEMAITYDCGLKLGITIEDSRGVKVVSFAPAYQSPELLQSASQTGVVTVTVPETNLVAGHYVVNVYYDDGTESQSVEGACELEVIAADVFGTGRVLGPEHGLVFLPVSWKLQSTGDGR